jgi:uncharacterized RDD family membrane protein YckC
MSSETGTPDAATAPINPLDEMWYVQGGAQALGPYRGHDVKAMIERGSIGARTFVAKVGASQWTALADTPAFAALGVLRNTVHYAGFWMRLLAYIVDQIAISIVTYPMAFLITFIFAQATGEPPRPDAIGPAIASFVINIILVMTYYTISLSSRWQATPGKRLCGIYVIREDGQKIGRGLALGRYFAALLSGLILCIGYAMIGFTKQKTGLHDMICSTRVIYGKAEDESQIADVFT